MTTANPSFDPSCPNNNTDIFYACDYGSRFLGCCNTNNVSSVCNSGCGEQIPASFDGKHYSDVTTNICPSGSDWYVCAYTKPTFFGCCKSNACANNLGCPSNNMTSAILSTKDAIKMPWNPIVPETPPSKSNKYTTGTVVASVIGGIFCGLILAILLVEAFRYFGRKVQRSRESAPRNRAADEERPVPVIVPMRFTPSPAANVRSHSTPPPVGRPVSRLFITNPTVESEEPPLPAPYGVNATRDGHLRVDAPIMGHRPSSLHTEQLPTPDRVPQPQTDFQGFFGGNRFTEAAGAKVRVLVEKVKKRCGLVA